MLQDGGEFFHHGGVIVLVTGGDAAVGFVAPGDRVLAPAGGFVLAGLVHDGEDALVQLLQHGRVVAAVVDDDGALRRDGVHAGFVARMEVGYGEGGLGIGGDVHRGDGGSGPGGGVHRLGYIAKGGVRMSTDAAEGEFHRPQARGAVDDVLQGTAVHADAALDFILMLVQEIDHAAHAAAALLPGGAQEDDVPAGTDIGGLQGADGAEHHGQGAGVIADTGGVEDAVLLADLRDAPKGEHGVQMAVHQHLLAGDGALQGADDVAALADVHVFQAFCLQQLREGLRTGGFLVGGSFDLRQADVLLKAPGLVFLGEGDSLLDLRIVQQGVQRLLHFARNSVGHGCLLTGCGGPARRPSRTARQP